MKRRFFVKSLVLAVGGAKLLTINSASANFLALDGTSLALQLSLSDAGRIGFYIDYSELSAPGTHTFFVCRTHGTQGQVTVGYASEGDQHNVVSGLLSWNDGEADIKVVTVDINEKNSGEHRMWLRLSNPTNGALLHNGQHTVAYGVIDDGTISSDAVFYDSNAVNSGDGSLGNPFNDIYTAISNIGNKRFLYGRGTTVPNTTNTTGAGGTAKCPCIFVPASRQSEENRLYIRNWPGSTWAINGASSALGAAGFYTEAGESYHTYKGIDFFNLDGAPTGSINGHAIMYRYGDSSAINIELCNADNINGTANNGAYQLWGVDGGKVWRCKSNNIQKYGDNTNANTGGVYSYLGKNLSVQRCEFNNSAQGVFHKRTLLGDVSTSVRFCIFKTNTGIHYSTSGSGDASHSYTIAQSNLFLTPTIGIDHNSGFNNALRGEKHLWSNNVFVGVGYGVIGAIHFNSAFFAQIYNNIFYNCRRIWNETLNFSSSEQVGIEYANYNTHYNTSYSTGIYGYEGQPHDSPQSLSNAAGRSLANEDLVTNPLFVARNNSAYGLASDSTLKNAGLSSSEPGLFLTGTEVIGPQAFSPASKPIQSPPSKTSLSATILPK